MDHEAFNLLHTSLSWPLSWSSLRLLTPSFEKIFERWNFTVLSRIFNISPISLFESLRFTKSMTSLSRLVISRGLENR